MKATHLLLLTASALAARGTASAQTAAAAPFHPGQWGIEAYSASNPRGGALVFLTKSTALVFDFGVNRYRTTDRYDSGFGVVTEEQTNMVLAGGLALRQHLDLTSRVMTTLGVGVVGDRTTLRYEQTGPGNSTKYRSAYLDLGPYVEAGGQYMVADRLSVGTGFRLAVTKEWRKVPNTPQPMKHTAYTTTAQFTPLRVALYF